jgi:hypothetical protein
MSWVLDQSLLHVTIGASPNTLSGNEPGRLKLTDDLQMVKAAILYADRARLCSPLFSVLLEGMSLDNLSMIDRINFPLPSTLRTRTFWLEEFVDASALVLLQKI